MKTLEQESFLENQFAQFDGAIENEEWGTARSIIFSTYEMGWNREAGEMESVYKQNGKLLVHRASTI